MALSQKFYKNKRAEFGGLLENSSLTLIYSGREIRMSEDANYPFQVNNNFYYLTGITEPDVLLVLEKNQFGEINEKLFINCPNLEEEKWVGKKIDYQIAESISGVSEIIYWEALFSELRKNEKIKNLYLDFNVPKHQSLKIPKDESGHWLKSLELKNAYPFFAELRVIKEPEEVEALVKANAITKNAFNEMKKAIKPGIYEYELAALFEFQIKKAGASGLAFETIAASGKNATILHYVSNQEKLKSGDLILFDLGAKWKGYCGDISRTLGVSGDLSPVQETLWKIVFDVQQELIKSYKPGEKLRELQEKTKALLFERCLEKALIKKETEINEYYYHGIGHPLGLDTHDIRPEKELVLKPGMVMTVEPGLYFKELGIGIRIEDDLLITSEGNMVF
ncbi:MAG: aminopeptidase P N-terminal domain-containing protein [Eubacteriaceae bacterium]